MKLKCLLITCAVLSVFLCGAASADNIADSTPKWTSVVNPDTKILKRTPVIDGNIVDGEWDTFYSYSNNGLDYTTYANWDNDNLYFAIKSNMQVDFLISLDMNADGWFNGDDNFVLRTSTIGTGEPILTVEKYASKDAKNTNAIVLDKSIADQISAKYNKDNNFYCTEVCIPKSLFGNVKIVNSDKSGILFAVKPNAENAQWIPSGEIGETDNCNYVTKKIVSLKPLSIGFDLRDCKIARGEDLIGKFYLTNDSIDSVNVKDFVIAGEGRSSDYLSSEKIRLDNLAKKQHISEEFKSIIPSDMPLGTWVVGSEVKSNDKRLGGVLISFDVVDVYDAKLVLPDKAIDSNTKEVTADIDITNNTKKTLRGETKIIVPDGWELWKNVNKKEFTIQGEDVQSSVTFKMKPPIGAKGIIPIEVDVNADGVTKKLSGNINIQ